MCRRMLTIQYTLAAPALVVLSQYPVMTASFEEDNSPVNIPKEVIKSYSYN
jgi:hypothetical protein